MLNQEGSGKNEVIQMLLDWVETPAVERRRVWR
jgi:hypothetical protein